MTKSTTPPNLSLENLKEELRQEIEAFAPQDFESQKSRHHLFGKLLKLKGAKSSGNFGSDPHLFILKAIRSAYGQFLSDKAKQLKGNNEESNKVHIRVLPVGNMSLNFSGIP